MATAAAMNGQTDRQSCSAEDDSRKTLETHFYRVSVKLFSVATRHSGEGNIKAGSEQCFPLWQTGRESKQTPDEGVGNKSAGKSAGVGGGNKPQKKTKMIAKALVAHVTECNVTVHCVQCRSV